MSIRKIKGGFRIRWYEGGTKRGARRQETIFGVTREEAEAVEAKRVATAKAKRASTTTAQRTPDSTDAAERLTFEQLAADYLEVQGRKMRASSRVRAEQIIEGHLVPELGQLRASGIRPIDVEKYRAKRLKAKASPSTVNREWTVLRAVLHYLEKFGAANPIRKKAVQALRVDDRKLIFFEPAEWRRFIAAFDDENRWRAYRLSVRHLGPVKAGAASDDPRRYGAGLRPDSAASDEYLKRLRAFRPVFETLLFTGARLGEILSLTWNDIDFTRGQVTVAQAKTGVAKVIPMSAGLRKTLEALPRGIGPSPVFNRGDGSAFYALEVQRAFRVAIKIAKLRDELTPHSLRHTFASWLVMKGTPLRTVQHLLGHASITMTLRYAHLSPEHLAGAVDLIAEVASLEGVKTVLSGEP